MDTASLSSQLQHRQHLRAGPDVLSRRSGRHWARSLALSVPGTACRGARRCGRCRLWQAWTRRSRGRICSPISPLLERGPAGRGRRSSRARASARSSRPARRSGFRSRRSWGGRCGLGLACRGRCMYLLCVRWLGEEGRWGDGSPCAGQYSVLKDLRSELYPINICPTRCRYAFKPFP
jgi:hypothetical protein